VKRLLTASAARSRKSAAQQRPPGSPIGRTTWAAATIAVWVGAGGGRSVAGPHRRVHPRQAARKAARRRARRPPDGGHQPCRHHPGPARSGVAVAGADGLAPWRLVHRSLGRPVAVPGKLAQRHRTGSRAAAAPGRRRPHSRRPPGTAWFVVEHVDPPHLLVLHSTTHVPAAWRARLGASIDLVMDVHLG
jgi:hypothetical protein